MSHIAKIGGRQSRSGKVRAVQEALVREGIVMKDAQTGNWKMKRLQASVRMGTNDVLQIRSAIDVPDDPVAAFVRQCSVPGNVRYGIAREGWHVVADTKIDGVAHLPRSLSEIQAGFCQLVGKKAPSVEKESEAVTAEVIEDHLNQLAEETIEIESGWEIRPRCEGVSIPIELCLTDRGARFRSQLLSCMPSDFTLLAVVDQSLRFNNQLRFCRLTIANNKLVAESTLHSKLIGTGAEWLQMAVRAVATARHRLSDPLRVLAEQSEVAKCYVELFLNT